MPTPFAEDQNGSCGMNIDANIERLNLKPTIQPFAGRIGGHQGLVLDPNDASNAELLKRMPDAAPLISLPQVFDLKAFSDIDLWKFGAIECVAHPRPSPTTTSSTPTTAAGVYATAAFFGPLVGGVSNFLFLTLFIFTFASVSGAHLNPTITLATFAAQLISFPRMILYIAGQILGGTLAGLMLRTAYGSRNFVVGGCAVDTALVSAQQALVLEFICCLTLIFLAFGIGLDPRQLHGTTLSPWLVGLALGTISWASAFTRPGYGGACKFIPLRFFLLFFFGWMRECPLCLHKLILPRHCEDTIALNPSRCFGVYVGSQFPGYHWVHWVSF
ncbi:MIP transporter [Penicillium riverlandense]|uniref:MIP transporter n=1 Tax=Penicillium riverlandense TaxID=1903569 RepID=UPI0025484C21|nr:MIP transporter [Penicillium riverlandense]KAJ5820222.1 MIP transporter [Penicillium riverlandense]